jgi:hypothetical protein
VINTRGIVYLVAIDDGDARVVYIIVIVECKTKPWHFLLMVCFVLFIYAQERESWICECEMCMFLYLVSHMDQV